MYGARIAPGGRGGVGGLSSSSGAGGAKAHAQITSVWVQAPELGADALGRMYVVWRDELDCPVEGSWGQQFQHLFEFSGALPEDPIHHSPGASWEARVLRASPTRSVS